MRVRLIGLPFKEPGARKSRQPPFSFRLLLGTMRRPWGGFMYILYLDESGNPDDPSDRHFVLAGAAVFERVVHFLTRSLDEVQAKHLPGLEPIDFHAAEIRSGRGFWRGVE